MKHLGLLGLIFIFAIVGCRDHDTLSRGHHTIEFRDSFTPIAEANSPTSPTASPNPSMSSPADDSELTEAQKKWVEVSRRLARKIESLVITELAPETLAQIQNKIGFLYQVAKEQGAFSATETEAQTMLLKAYFARPEVSIEDSQATIEALYRGFQTIHVFPPELKVIPISACTDLVKIGSREPYQMSRGDQVVPLQVYRLVTDIDCSGIERAQYNPNHVSRALTDHIDGDGYTVKNLVLPDTNTYAPLAYSGLFGETCDACVIANLKIVNADIGGGAILVGLNKGKISHVKVQGRLHKNSEMYSAFGGITTHNYGGLIEYSSAEVEVDVPVTTSDEVPGVGGLAAANEEGEINFCSAKLKGSVTGVGGGLVGRSNKGSIKNSSAEIDIQTINAETTHELVGITTDTEILDSEGTGSIRPVTLQPPPDAQ